jgi:hypothetical protein
VSCILVCVFFCQTGVTRSHRGQLLRRSPGRVGLPPSHLTCRFVHPSPNRPPIPAYCSTNFQAYAIPSFQIPLAATNVSLKLSFLYTVPEALSHAVAIRANLGTRGRGRGSNHKLLGCLHIPMSTPYPVVERLTASRLFLRAQEGL